MEAWRTLRSRPRGAVVSSAAISAENEIPLSKAFVLSVLSSVRSLMRNPLILKIVPVYACNNNVIQIHRLNGLGQLERLVRIQRDSTSGCFYSAETATTGTRISHDHECSCSPAPAFSDIWTSGLFAHGVKIQAGQSFLKMSIGVASW